MTKHTAVARRDFAVQSRQITEAQDWMQRINGPHRLQVHNQSQLYFKHYGTEVGHVATGFIRYSTEATIIAQDLTQSYCIGLPLKGEQYISVDQAEFLSTPDTGVILSPNMSFQMTMAENCEKRMVRLSRFAVEECLRQLLLKNLDQPLVFKPQMDLVGQAKPWVKLFQQLLPLLESHNSLVGEQILWQPLEQALIKSLLYLQPHNYSEQLLGLQRPAYLLSLEDELRSCVMESLTLAEIEKRAGVSRDRLYRDFQRYYGIAPMAYFKRLKLDGVRQRLLQAHADETVSAIALDYGFNQLGRFSQEYKEHFNELPSETLARRIR